MPTKKLSKQEPQRAYAILKPDGTLSVIDGVVVETIECNRCHTAHQKDSDTYIVIEGNIAAGSGGGFIGNGEWDRLGIPVTYYCPDCFVEEAKSIKKSLIKI